MRRSTFSLIAFAAALLVPAVGFAQGQAQREVSCTRGGLKRAVDLYLEAQTSGDISKLPLATGVAYIENMALADVRQGIITKPMVIDHSLSLYDEDSCQTFTEVIVTNPEEPYVLGTRLRVNHDKIAEVEILWTTTGYWLFDAEAYLEYSSAENWGPIPAEERASRGTLVSAANAYLDAFLEGKIDLVPWGFPCVRIEGGAYTGRGSPDDSCEVGVPAGVNIVNRRFVVDEVIGAVVVFCTFGPGGQIGGSGAPDTHLFRVENGKLRYVHTLTHLKMEDFRRRSGGGGG
ncbi:MAG: hypothetical protein LOD94_16220 [Gammaproteobacteria bacterium]|nr:hypothetical protein [Gammaproteobacteria bacterium]